MGTPSSQSIGPLGDFRDVVFIRPLSALFAGFILYRTCRVLYNLYLSPLRKFPGPKLAAATHIYEMYYDIYKGGQYTSKLKELHDQYGPIVRISPAELHICDPDFYGELYTGSTNPREKWTAFNFNLPSSALCTGPHELHRVRRAPMNHFFSKKTIFQLEDRVVSKVELMCRRVAEFKESGKPLSMRYLYAALAIDVVTEYCFANSYNSLNDPEFCPQWADAVDSLSKGVYMLFHFPWIKGVFNLLQEVPMWLLRHMSTDMRIAIEFQWELRRQIMALMKADAENKPDHGPPTIFQELLRSEMLPPMDRNIRHFQEEAQVLVSAGQSTTAYHLQITSWYILTTPGVLEKLRAELIKVMPDPKVLPPLKQLEDLPYLSAIVSEGHRMSHGVVHRLARRSPHSPIRFHEWTIPANTPVGMSAPFIHHDPSIFPSPTAFRPERWLGPDAQRLQKYLVPFSKGTRACLGMHLGQAEIYLALAAMFRRFEFEVFETVQEDVDWKSDYFIPLPREGSAGLRVLVR